jgi:hypothetical protein
MIEIQKVVSCPVVKTTVGLIEIVPMVIGQLAGAVWDKSEWMTIGLGERHEGGLRVVITDLWTPPKQTRNGCHVRPYRGDEPTEEERFPDWVLERMVCGIHSHNSMSAKFSGSFNSKGDGGDLSSDGICSHYASSIVIATPRHTNSESRLLGFEYDAIVYHDLTCGELGASYAKVMPHGVEGWPFSHKIMRSNAKAKLESLGDCPNASRYKTGQFTNKLVAICGLETISSYKPSAFGEDGEPILSQLPAPNSQVPGVAVYRRDNRVEIGDYWNRKKREEDTDKYIKLWEEKDKEEDWARLYDSYLG